MEVWRNIIRNEGTWIESGHIFGVEPTDLDGLDMGDKEGYSEGREDAK